MPAQNILARNTRYTQKGNSMCLPYQNVYVIDTCRISVEYSHTGIRISAVIPRKRQGAESQWSTIRISEGAGVCLDRSRGPSPTILACREDWWCARGVCVHMYVGSKDIIPV